MSAEELRRVRDTARNAYFELLRTEPNLFYHRFMRPLVLDPATIERFAETNAVTIGVLAETPYVYLVADLVERSEPDGTTVYFPYTRTIRRASLEGLSGAVAYGVIVNPAAGRVGDVVLVRQERHATGRIETELPRGFGKPGESPEDVALRELREETGFIGTRATRLAEITVDSGMEDGTVWLVQVDVEARGDAQHDEYEAIDAVITLSVAELRAAIASGEIRDGFTLAALGALQR